MSRQMSQKIAFAVLTALAVIVILPIVLVVAYIVVNGIGAISWGFLTDFPKAGMKEGGILPAVIGTVVLTFGTAIVSIPIAIGAARRQYLSVQRIRPKRRQPHSQRAPG